VFDTFLAAPLLQTTGVYTEQKFSGSDEAGNNVDTIGHAIDAYAHHILVNTYGTFLLTDLQGVITSSYPLAYALLNFSLFKG